MYYSTKAIKGFKATAKDGAIGKIAGFCFDEHTWKLPYVMANTGWFGGHVISIDPGSIKMIDGSKRRVYFDATRAELMEHTGESSAAEREEKQGGRLDTKAEVTGLRDSSAVIGYRAAAIDGPAGKVADLIIDTKHWQVHEVVIREGLLLRRQHAISPQWIASIDAEAREMKLDVNRETLGSSRRFDPAAAVNTTLETRVVDYKANTHLESREEVPV